MADGNLQFRIATLDDAPRIQQLVQSAFRAEDSRPRWTDDLGLSPRFTVDVEEVTRRISGPDGAFLVAGAAPDDHGVGVGVGVPVACVEVSRRGGGGGGGLARISMLAVDERRQRGGVGRRVLAHAEDYCRRTWGVGRVGLNALSARPELIAWYTRRGYRDTGERTPFPRERSGDLVLPDDLCFVELEKDV